MLNGGLIPFPDVRFPERGAVLVAVSGGSDSMALLHLHHSQCVERALPIRLVAATVDHGLRPGSAREAADVAEICRQRGIEHFTLRWEGQKPAAGLQAAARMARHKLLADLAEREGCAAVLVGHTRDDHIETLLMRAARGEGEGLAGIAPATLFDKRVWFMRPLLNETRADLRAWLRSRDLGWLDDPSNSDQRFERVRMRQRASELTEEARDESLDKANVAARARVRLSHACAQLIRGHVGAPLPGLIHIKPEILTVDRAALVHTLRILLAISGGASHLPPADRTMQIVDELLAGQRKANLSRAIIDVRSSGVYILRETRGLPPSDERTDDVWDRRFRLRRAAAAQAAILPDTIPANLVKHAQSTLPTLSPGQSLAPMLSPWADFLPLFDLEAASAAAAAIGAEIPPQPPFCVHKKFEV